MRESVCHGEAIIKTADITSNKTGWLWTVTLVRFNKNYVSDIIGEDFAELLSECVYARA